MGEPPGSTVSIGWGDTNGDGKVDALASGGQEVRVYPITSTLPSAITGTLPVAITSTVPASAPSITLPILGVDGKPQPADKSKAVTDWGDVDGDGYPDLAVGVPVEGFYSAPARVYRNDPATGLLTAGVAGAGLAGQPQASRGATSTTTATRTWLSGTADGLRSFTSTTAASLASSPPGLRATTTRASPSWHGRTWTATRTWT